MAQHIQGVKMSLWSVVLLFLLSSISTKAHPRLRSEEEMSWLYKEWQVKFDKAYENPWERERRFEIFKDNLLFIDRHNDPRNNYTYTLGLNSLADLSYQEYKSKYLFPIESDVVYQQSSVSAVVYQQSWGSCWAWGAAGAVEGLYHIQTGEMIRVSAQQLVDCVKRCRACKGGWTGSAYDYIIKNNGIDSLENYPYGAEEGVCKQDSSRLVTINGWRRVFPIEEQLRRAVANQPVSIALDAFGRDFQLSDRGVFSGNCSTSQNHVILVVGYGSENGQDYWLSKNSWDFNRGEDGYIKIRHNVGGKGKCGLLEYANYPY